jgi:hypothetical protein
MPLSREELRQLALGGAKARLQELETERRSLMREFPELGSRTPKQGGRKRRMTAAQRKAISKRMKAMWAARRKARGKAA